MSTATVHRRPVLRGSEPMSAPVAVPTPQGARGRRCKAKGCRTVLSVYNRGDRCYIHQRRRKVTYNRTADLELRWVSHGTAEMRHRGCKCSECRP